MIVVSYVYELISDFKNQFLLKKCNIIYNKHFELQDELYKNKKHSNFLELLCLVKL